MEIFQKINKKIVILSLMSAILLIFSSCGEKAKPWSEDGSILKLTAETPLSGFYVKNTPDKEGNTTVSPLFNSFSETDLNQELSSDDETKEVETEGKDKYIWFPDTKKVKMTNLIPVVSKDTPLIFTSEEEPLDSIFIEGYYPLGYTVGTSFKLLSDDRTVMIMPDLSLEDTTAAKALKDYTDGEYEISKINNSKDIPLANIDNNCYKLTGLERMMVYQFSFFQGTKEHTFNALAETNLFVSKNDGVQVTSPFTKTQNGYFFVNLPENLEKGYYYIKDYGLFYFTADKDFDNQDSGGKITKKTK
jgi:hypothetical protein